MSVANTVEVCLLGSQNSGKTSIASVYANNIFYDDHVSSFACETYAKNVMNKKELTNLRIVDTPGTASPQVYQSAGVILLCFSMEDETSLKDLKEIHSAELSNYLKKRTPIILVGTKSDIKGTTTEEIVSFDKSLKIAEEIRDIYNLNVAGVVECSAKTKNGLNELFEEVIRRALNQAQPKKEPNFTKYLTVPKTKKKPVFVSVMSMSDMDDDLNVDQFD